MAGGGGGVLVSLCRPEVAGSDFHREIAVTESFASGGSLGPPGRASVREGFLLFTTEPQRRRGTPGRNGPLAWVGMHASSPGWRTKTAEKSDSRGALFRTLAS